MEDNNNTSTTRINENEESKLKISSLKSDEEIIKYFKEMKIDSENLPTLVNNLCQFNSELINLKDIDIFLTNHNLNILRKISSKENIAINLVLKKIYMNLISNDSLYSNYLSNLIEAKINLIYELIEECSSLINKLNVFVFDEDLFRFKLKLIELVKCICFNCKKQLDNNSYKKFQTLMNTLPGQFFSEAFNEFNKDKTLYEVRESLNKDVITNFEDKFSQINNYYEQFDSFKKFVEFNLQIKTYDSVAGTEDTLVKEGTKTNQIDFNNIDFYQQYGSLLLKFCKYHHYIFLNGKNKEEGNKEENKDNKEESDNIRVVFLLDKIKPEDENDQKDIEGEQGPKNIEKIMNRKLFISVLESKEYQELMKKLLNDYLSFTKSIENEPKIKEVISQMKYFLSIANIESFVPLYLTDFSKVIICDNFTPSFLTNVPAGKTNELYLETKEDETILVYIEFFLEDKSKDISFEVNKYDINLDSYKLIFSDEKIDETFKFFILCKGYSLYQIKFINNYSWFTSKDVNYRISLLKFVDKNVKIIDDAIENNKIEGKKGKVKKEIIRKKRQKKEVIKSDEDSEDKEKEKKVEEEEEEEKEEEENEETNKDKITFKINGKSISKEDLDLKIKKIKEEKDENLINIPIILYLNNLRIYSKEKDQFIETIEEDESFIPRELFNFTLVNYIKKTLKITKSESKKKNINISIFSQNRDLSFISSEVEELMEGAKSKKEKKYIAKLGFYPNEDLEGFKVKFNLYDLCEQSLFYRIFLSNNQMPEKPLLFIQFDKLTANAAIFDQRGIYYRSTGKNASKLNSSNLDNININDLKRLQIFIKSVNSFFNGINILISCIDLDEEMKETISKLIENIKKYCEEKTHPTVEIYLDDENEIAKNVLNYIY